MSIFKNVWQKLNKSDALNQKELDRIRDKMDLWDDKNVPYSVKVDRVKRLSPKLKEQYRAEQVIRTEDKRLETEKIKEDAEELDIDRFTILTQPTECDVCQARSQNGTKIYTQSELDKLGGGPPWHPNCYCLLVPEI